MLPGLVLGRGDVGEPVPAVPAPPVAHVQRATAMPSGVGETATTSPSLLAGVSPPGG